MCVTENRVEAITLSKHRRNQQMSCIFVHGVTTRLALGDKLSNDEVRAAIPLRLTSRFQPYREWNRKPRPFVPPDMIRTPAISI